jgi:hypothetical protein
MQTILRICDRFVFSRKTSVQLGPETSNGNAQSGRSAGFSSNGTHVMTRRLEWVYVIGTSLIDLARAVETTIRGQLIEVLDDADGRTSLDGHDQAVPIRLRDLVVLAVGNDCVRESFPFDDGDVLSSNGGVPRQLPIEGLVGPRYSAALGIEKDEQRKVLDWSLIGVGGACQSVAILPSHNETAGLELIQPSQMYARNSPNAPFENRCAPAPFVSVRWPSRYRPKLRSRCVRFALGCWHRHCKSVPCLAVVDCEKALPKHRSHAAGQAIENARLLTDASDFVAVRKLTAQLRRARPMRSRADADHCALGSRTRERRPLIASDVQAAPLVRAIHLSSLTSP